MAKLEELISQLENIIQQETKQKEQEKLTTTNELNTIETNQVTNSAQ